MLATFLLIKAAYFSIHLVLLTGHIWERRELVQINHKLNHADCLCQHYMVTTTARKLAETIWFKLWLICTRSMETVTWSAITRVFFINIYKKWWIVFSMICSKHLIKHSDLNNQPFSFNPLVHDDTVIR